MPPSPRAERLDAHVLRARPLPADRGADKHDRGTVLVVGGSACTPGAVVLAGVAALRAGAGRLQIVTAAEVAGGVAIAVPEALVAPFDPGRRPTLSSLVAAADAVVVGPGTAGAEHAAELLATVVDCAAPSAVVVVDAAAIPALGRALRPDRLAGRLVLTPNFGELDELSELVGAPDGNRSAGVTDDRAPDAARRMAAVARHLAAAVVCFDCVAGPDGRVWIDPEEAVLGLGTSGAGDVLAGIAGGLAARCGDATTAALWAAVAHRTAGRRLARAVAPVGYLARELADEVPAALAAVDGASRASPAVAAGTRAT